MTPGAFTMKLRYSIGFKLTTNQPIQALSQMLVINFVNSGIDPEPMVNWSVHTGSVISVTVT